MSENELHLDNHLLVCIEVNVAEKDVQEYSYLKANFCGRVVCAQKDDLGTLDFSPRTSHGSVFVCGDIQLLRAQKKHVIGRVRVIREFSINVDGMDDVEYVTLGEVPINLHNAGVYYRDFLGHANASNTNYFDSLQARHKFQALTESNKPGTSFRSGIYLSEVKNDGDASEFHLLRCSTNFQGPTLAFADEDREILTRVNTLARSNFVQKTDLNHVLAQIYHNTIIFDDANKSKERKAKIRSHSDKTKDMPANGLIVFCTFYSSDMSEYKAPMHDRFDRCFKDGSVLTQLKFKLKDEARDTGRVREFCVPLYPNSILLVPLSTNRFWTHETCPPSLPIGKFPTRLGYVVRCSKTGAVFRNGTTYVHREGEPDVKLEKPTPEDISELKRLYQLENATTKLIEYKDIFFSLNDGDYTRPIVE